MRRWRISYLPRSKHPRVVEWVFQGSEFELDEYLQKNHSCSCPDCKDVYWWDSAEACEYQVEEIVEEENMSIKESVKRFNHIKGTPPISIDGDREAFWKSVQNQAKLVLEEAQEQYDNAMLRDIVELVDGASDVAYTQAYMDVLLEEVGINLPLAKELVCDNNDQKITTDEEFARRSAIEHLQKGEMCYVDEAWYDRMFYYVVKRKLDGKVLKLIGHQSPNIADAIPEETFEFVGEKVVSD